MKFLGSILEMNFMSDHFAPVQEGVIKMTTLSASKKIAKQKRVSNVKPFLQNFVKLLSIILIKKMMENHFDLVYIGHQNGDFITTRKQ